MPRKKDGVDQEIERLFSFDPSEFVAARDELAKGLKAEGKADESTEVKALRRPTVAAWAANRVAREHPAEVEELLEAGAELRQAQRKALSGVKAGGLREASERRRRAVASLIKAAEAFLSSAGKGSAGAMEALQSTFEAASVDHEAGDALKAGRLERELTAVSGFGDVSGLEVVAAPRERPSAKKESADRAAQMEAARRDLKDLEKAAAEARRRAIKARSIADRAVAETEQLTAKAEQSRAHAQEATSLARKAEIEAERSQALADRRAKKLEERG